MTQAMSVPLVVPGVAAAVQQLNQTAQAFKNVAQAQGQVAQASQRVTRAIGPNQRLVRAQYALHNALLHGGSPAEIADAQRAVARLQQQLAPKVPRTPPPPKVPTPPAPPKVSGPNQALAHAQAALAAATTPEEEADAQLAIARAQRQLNPAAFSRTQRIPAPPSLPSAGGPHQRLAQARAALASAQTPAQVADAQLAIQRAQATINKVNQPPPSVMSRLGKAALSSRFNLGSVGGARVYPLVGRSLAALGIEGELAGAVGLVAGAAMLAVTALKNFGDAVMDGGRALKEISDAAATTGGTGAQAGQLRSLGISAGFANALRERLATDPLAMLAGAQLGIPRVLPYQLAGPGGQNSMTVVLKTLQALADVQKRGGDPVRFARMLGAEDLLPLLNMSEKARLSLLKTSEVLGKLADANKQTVSDYDAAVKKAQSSGDAIGAAIFAKIAPMLTALNNWATDVNMAIVKWLNGGKLPPNTPTPGTANPNTNPHGIQGSGVYGGGPRAAGAFPANLNGQYLNNASRATGPRMGYW